ncbi:MAG: holo-ACP synthase [Desulfovibrio sp.]|nr:holo-ACP synthase [Desulfovibrio sp.]
MIVGLGTDIVEILRLERVYTRFGRRFLEKILTPRELDTLPATPATTVAGRFAAKEAAVKALGTGFSRGITPLHIEITRSSRGAPKMTFLGKAKELELAIGIRRSLLSISHERTVAVAVVILEA